MNGALAPDGRPTWSRDVNCVDTDTGLAANVATEGLVQGGIYGQGLLRPRTPGPGATPTGGTANRTLHLRQHDYSINDDVLTCYFTNGTTSIADIAKASYNGGVVLDPGILTSPRFFYVPVLAIQPTSGGSETYSIIDFRRRVPHRRDRDDHRDQGIARPARRTTGCTSRATTSSRSRWSSSTTRRCRVEGDIPLIDYLGTGTRVIRLID